MAKTASSDAVDDGAEVRRVDQDNINRFARLNARLHEARKERDELKKTLEHLDDASTELMMADAGSGKVMVMYGESFFETTEEEATEHCENQVDETQAKIDELRREEDAILSEQADLKRILYGRFGKNINLEESEVQQK